VACAWLAASGRGTTATIETLLLAAAGLSAAAWLIGPAWIASVLTLLAALGMGIRAAHDPSLRSAVQLMMLAALTLTAALHSRRTAARLRLLSQTVDDLDEQRTLKDQSTGVAAKAEEALKRKYARYQHLQSIAEQLSGLTSLEAIANLAVESAFKLIGKSEVCLLFLLDHEEQELALFASKRQSSQLSIRAKHGDQFDRYVLRTHRPLLVNDVRRDFRFTVNLEPDRPLSSVIACPLLLGQSAEGVLRLDSQRSGAYTQDDLRFLDILLDLIATAVTNARLFARTQQLALTDGLTGLALRRPFLDAMARELSRSARSGEPMAICMADVDHFKRFNDTFGHTAGDLILKGVAQAMQSVVPEDGLTARFGGEEFAVLLPRMHRAGAAVIAEAFRKAVSEGLRQLPGGPHGSVTISVGVAVFPDDGTGDLELIRAADQRLYQAKKMGRNRVC
jgi:diguanylate cyclase (GGDEF)-like protein